MSNFFVTISNAVRNLFGPIGVMKFHGRLSLDSDPREIFKKFAPAFSEDTEALHNLELDLTHCEFIYPSMLIFMLSIRDTLLDKGVGLRLNLEAGSAIHEYLDYCGFGKYFGLAPFPEGTQRRINPDSHVYSFQDQETFGDAYKIARDLIDLLKVHQPLSPRVESTAIDSIYEIFRNISQHSGHKRYLLLGQTYPKSKRIRFTIYDNGIGIKNHLTRLKYSETHPYFKKVVSEELYEEIKRRPANLAIEEAARYMVSATNYNPSIPLYSAATLNKGHAVS